MIPRAIRQLSSKLNPSSPEKGEVKASSVRLWHPDRFSGTVPRSELEAVLKALEKRPFHPLGSFLSKNEAGYSLRADLSRGLTESAGNLLDFFKEKKLFPAVALAFIASGDLGFGREGKYVLPETSLGRIKKLEENYGFSLAALADPCAVFTGVQNSPFGVWQRLSEELSRNGIVLEGLASSFHADPAALLNRLWIYRALGLFRQEGLFQELSKLGFENWPFLYETKTSGEGFFRQNLDGITVDGFSLSPAPPVYVRQIAQTISWKPKLNFKTKDFILIASMPGGWLCADSKGSGLLNAGELVERIQKAPSTARFLIVTDPSDFASERKQPAARHLSRELPYPYTHYFSLNSDVDWSSRAQWQKANEILSGQFGFAHAGSAFLFSAHPEWVAWQSGSEPKLPSELLRAAGRGWVDTVHGLEYSMDPARLLRESVKLERETGWDFEPARNFSFYEGLLIQAECAEESRLPSVKLKNKTGERLLRPSAFYKNAASNDSVASYEFPRDFQTDEILRIELVPAAEGSGLKVFRLETLKVSSRKIKRLLDLLREHHVSLPVFTSHGGGEGTLEHGACLTPDYAAAHPDLARFAMDRAQTPYAVLKLLKEAGVYFFNPLGLFSSEHFCKAGELLKPFQGQNGIPFYGFPRFWKRQEGAEFAYGKHEATVQALPAVLGEMLMNLRWAEPWSGGILYTHLGHRNANQVSQRLGWPEELFSAFENLREYSCGLDAGEPSSFQVWNAPASRILAHALISQNISKHLEIKGDEIHIQSWTDPVLEARIPDPAVFGTSWLHGLTIYAGDERTAKVFVDGKEIRTFTRNPADGSGVPSVTLVDDSSPEPVLQIPLDQTGPSEKTFEIPEVSLANATHFSFEIRGVSKKSWKMGFQTHEGRYFEAGNMPGLAWSLDIDAEETDFQKITLAFDTAKSAFPVRGKIMALSFYGEAAVRNICLYRALGPRKIPQDRILAGRVVEEPGARPVSGARVICQGPDGRREAVTDQEGFYIFRGLQAGACYEVSCAKEGNLFYARGKAAGMSCDYWDWDIYALR